MELNRRRVLSGSSAALVGLFLSSYATATEGSSGSATVGELGASVSAFGLDVHHELVAEDPGANLLVSPYSASIALAMTWAGARGETEIELADALRFPYEQDELHAVYGQLDDLLESVSTDDEESSGEDWDDEVAPPGELSLSTANALWGQAGYPFSEAFLERLSTHYGAGMNEVDYGADPEAAREEINAWVEAQTEERIEDLLPQGSLDELTRLVLTNAVYFAADWQRPFFEELTAEAPFTTLTGETVTAKLMHHAETERLPYAEVDGTQVVSLPYAGEEVDMVCLLPPEGEFEAVEASLDGATLETMLEALEPTYGSVSLPQFSFESDFSLVETLEALGVEAAFEPSTANFSGMVDEDEMPEDFEGDDHTLYIDDVFQQTFIGVDEFGTEAAAATAVIVGDESEPPAPAFEFVADRPFLFLIRHRETNTVLFLGRVVELEDAGESEDDGIEVGEYTARDVDGDGLYRDLNGNGRLDSDDVVVFFEHLDEPAVQGNVDAFDFSGSGSVGFGDVVALFESL
ncbi:serpin family protein [Natronobiforma cellulositropha]|uniref:serpin family protein n=1 Tax=Natronobiforma cellulositropha TaxID=1679076 RepID=UPI0021D58864|nr:serpin family protein [Natronobiforma cellulositropha]